MIMVMSVKPRKYWWDGDGGDDDIYHCDGNIVVVKITMIVL